MHWLWVLIVGAIIGLIAGAITNKGGSMGWIANIVAGLVGSAIGQAILGSWVHHLLEWQSSHQLLVRLLSLLLFHSS